MSKKSEQLGMNPGTASNRLKKMLLWKYIIEVAANYCFQCGDTIENIDELSIEHKQPWLDSDDSIGLFFNLDNIAFSHLSCNVGAKRHNLKTMRAVGEANSHSKLTHTQIDEIRELYNNKLYDQYELAENFGVDQSTISKIVNNKLWKVEAY